ncbi:small integral membrane protein 22 [Rhinatrema bivittatum]|uniref:small integral membrane protein 22 n=1 Tax=Rhinatrema bivittatum TaxID=194408 RepID=UPI001127C7B7|nr:small integral membrane protein 22 [Rhinatrema bivittatum]XP_029433115.1 small integral membrane protein 22 [Rhinatrema bivittatum]XP_029433116.1 small integral membrane protein 22 [Rhinatrema bivittatum]
MSQSSNDVGAQIESQINDALSRLANKQMFQSDWDIAAFVIFFTFIGVVLLLIILVLIRCFCCCCCDCESSAPKYKKADGTKVGVDNLAMEP